MNTEDIARTTLGAAEPFYPPTFSGAWLHKLAFFFSAPVMLWALLWIAIDTGPWNLEGFSGTFSALDAVRAAFPLFVLVIILFWWALHARTLRIPTLAEGGIWLYGLLMLLMSVRAAPWFMWGYWGLAFLAPLALTYAVLSGRAPLETLRQLNWASWIYATAALAIMLIYARAKLFVGNNLSAYGIVNRAGPFLGAAISRSSGLSRLAAVPGILGLIYVLRERGWARLIAGTALTLAATVIWIMQSRGSLFSFMGAMAFILCFGGPRARRWGILIGVMAVVMMGVDLGAGGHLLQDLWAHATRHTGLAGFRTMSGRPRIWRHAFRYIDRRPWLGYGPQADRRLGIGDAQNLIVYCLLSTGIVGTMAFVLGFASAWLSFFRVLHKRIRLPQRDQRLVIACGAILAFLSLRSIPEDGASYFSVDLLLQLPAMVYLAVLSRKLAGTPDGYTDHDQFRA